MSNSKWKTLCLCAALLVGSAACAQQHGDSAMSAQKHVMVNEAGVKWMPGPPFLPPGVKLAVLEGDPSKEGLYTVRLQMPANYTIPPHTHPTAEHVTVIQGSLYMGSGKSLNRAGAMQLTRGGFAVIPASFAHYAFCRGKAVVQVHGMGPFAINYINPSDDPRNKK
ncbi:cupin domain-containing protein [Flaviaesturariibacter terrae]